MKKQVVLIMTDTQRKDMLGCYGGRGMETANLDRLAGDGVRLERAYCCQPVCGPARSGIFTGTWPHINGGWGNSMALGDNVKTIGQRLSDEGIKTGYIGKWHLDGSDYFGLGRCPDGWDPDYWYDMRNYLEELSEEERLRSRKWETSESEDLDETFTFGHRCSDRAIDFIEKHRDEDFFLVVSYDEPHGPCLSPKRFSGMYKDMSFPGDTVREEDMSGKPEHQRAWSKAASVNHEQIRYFLGCNTFVDYEIGRVLDTIDLHVPGSMVIYTADHGDMAGDHNLTSKGPAMYDQITNIPFIARWKGRIGAGTVCENIASHIDICPTVMEVFGLEVPKSLQGSSMLRMLENPERAYCDMVFMEFGRYEIDHDGYGGFQPIRCCFDGRYKLVINLLSSDEFYDLREDPGELVNLIDSAEYCSARDKLHDGLLEWMNRTRDPFRGYYWHRRPWRSDAPEPSYSYTGYTRQREPDGYEPRQLDYDTGLEMVRPTRRK